MKFYLDACGDVYDSKTGLCLFEQANEGDIKIALLLVAAPELLDACELALAELADYLETDDATSFTRNVYETVINAIAKAKGAK